MPKKDQEYLPIRKLYPQDQVGLVLPRMVMPPGSSKYFFRSSHETWVLLPE